MNSNLLFDFTVNKENNTINIKREFDANLQLVWKAWTSAEILDQWWAPEPFKNKTKILDFKEGGMWHYAMVSPENKMHWNRFDYEKIEVQKMFTGWDGFCNEEGAFVETEFSRIHWKNNFSDNSGSTIVNVTLTLDSLEGLEKIIEMGFKEGFTAGLNQLDKLLLVLNK
ncbi:SRPBCC family protein [Tenacibaculum sp. SDUM215027]|uniref:SRPBCC family protein n=1 Tax=Tenacibaculum sp. SDUM215027 TaxID=3422596 RepID=UPI003D313E7D